MQEAMTYGPPRQTPGGRPPFTNVFVNPSSYRAFLQSGAWPDGTLFVLEARDSLPANSASGGERKGTLKKVPEQFQAWRDTLAAACKISRCQTSRNTASS